MRRIVLTRTALFSALLACSLLAGCGRNPPHLLLLITVDTLRADRLGAYGDHLGLTPNLDRLAAKSLVFDYAVTPAPFTLPALSALHTSLYPEELGVRSNDSILPPDAPLLAETLRDAGWHTGAVTSNYVLHRGTGISRGFEQYDHDLPLEEKNRPIAERTGAETTAAAVKMLDALRSQGDGRAFLWVHYQDPHGPYTPPETCAAPAGAPPDGVVDRVLPVSPDERGFDAIPSYQLLGDERDSRSYRAAYNGEVRCVDRAIGALLDAVRERALLEDAVVVFAADHGESLGERGVWFSHGSRLGAPQTHVPLLLRVPGRRPERRADVASLLDVTPTILQLVGAAPLQQARGRDLLEPKAQLHASKVLLSTLAALAPERRIGLIENGYRYVVATGPEGTKSRMVRLGDESGDLAVTDPDRGNAMRLALTVEFAGLRMRKGNFLGLSPEEAKRLRALGYVESR